MRYQRDTSAGVIVYHHGEEGCRFLLVLSRLTRRPLWEFPKGGVDPGETLLETALRELREETGLESGDLRLIPDFKRTEQYRFMVGRGEERTLVRKQVTYFLAEALHRNVRPSVTEVSECAWLELGEALRRVRYGGRRRILEEAARRAGCGAASLNRK